MDCTLCDPPTQFQVIVPPTETVSTAGFAVALRTLVNPELPIVAEALIIAAPCPVMVSAAESPVHQNWKDAILNAKETDTLFLNEPEALELTGAQETQTALQALARTARTVVINEYSFANVGTIGGRWHSALGGVGHVDESIAGMVA